MKQLIFSLLFLAACCSASFAQTSAADSALTLDATVGEGAFVLSQLPEGSLIAIKIAKAIHGKTDTAELVSYEFQQRDYVDITLNSTYVREGLSAAVNARLKGRIQLLLPFHPWLRDQLTQIFERNESQYNAAVENGLTRANQIAQAWNSN